MPNAKRVVFESSGAHQSTGVGNRVYYTEMAVCAVTGECRERALKALAETMAYSGFWGGISLSLFSMVYNRTEYCASYRSFISSIYYHLSLAVLLVFSPPPLASLPSTCLPACLM